jgi:hypothetical protein
MNIHLTGFDIVTAKKTGTRWAKMSGVSSESGEVIEVMMEADKLDEEAVKKAVLSKEELKEAFGAFEPIQVFFDKRGRVDSIVP